MMTSVSLVTLGCKANQFESAAMETLLVNHGYTVCAFEQGAELVIINTCTVTAATDAQSRKLIRRARRLNPDCRIVVTGCYAQICPQQVAELPGVIHVIGNMEKSHLIEILQHQGPCVQVGDISRQQQCPDLKIATFSEHSRAFVQIQSGCNAFCSYCIIPYARGRSRSVPLQSVIEQIRDLVRAGYQEVVLTGIHIGNYGRDLQPDGTLSHLVEAILTHTDVARLRLGSVEPQEVTPELIACVAASPRVCPHFHIPLQSGCDAVLKRMNRHYTTDDFERTIKAIRAQIPRASIGIDLISGFPGETDEDHRQTWQFVASLPVHYLHVFPFSARPGTPAASMTPQIRGAVAKERAAQLRQLGAQKTEDYSKQFIGQNVAVVVENRTKNGHWQGRSAEYLCVIFKHQQGATGQIVRLQITGRRGETLVGTVC